ncbi:hypothetical protein ACIQC9_14045 [Brevundimonas sp. NPDC092305]|uniref:hypothetical protein n=1 Tax=Brevundimonas sp. NPDC092305 TaxID=3363957 RepID=UPI00380D8E9F
MIAALWLAPNAGLAETVSYMLNVDEPIVTAPRVAEGRINTSGQSIELVVPLRERGPLGQVSVLIGSDDAVKVRGADLIGLVSRIVTPAAVEQLRSIVDADGYISPAAARTIGFDLTFDPALLDLAVSIPVEARQRQTLGLGFDSSVINPTPSADPEPFSLYLNYRASLDYVHVSEGGREEGLRAPRFDIDLNGTVGKVAFENLLTVDPDADEEVQRNASRLIYDQPDKILRWTVGDLFPEGTSFQSAPDIAGLSVQRLYSLSPSDRFVASRSSRTITLREESNIEIRVNGALARTLTLAPGTYDLRDLPLTQGANAVEIVIESLSGQREVILFDFFSDNTLLAPGIDEFYAGVGIQAPREAGRIDYQEEEPVFSGFYRRGITEQITLGANAQATQDAQLVGGEMVYGGPWGLTALDIAFSNRDEGSGYAARVEHRLSREVPQLAGRETFDVSVETRSQDFAAIENLGGVDNYRLQIAARYARPFTETLSGSIGGDYAVGRDQLEDRYGASAFASWRVNYDTLVNFGVTYASNSLVGAETNVFINLTRRFGSRSTLSVGAESQNGLLRAGYSRAPERMLNDWGFSADVTRTDDAFGFNGAATYTTNRGDFEVDHFTVFDDARGDISSQQTSLRAYGSIAMAGSKVGVGRRIYDSFALVDGHPTLEGRRVLIRGVEAIEESAYSDGFGPAVVPIGSYYPQTVPYDVENLPLGYDLGSGLFQLLPRFHSGYALTVGSAYNVTASGQMVDPQAFPVSLRTGEAVSLDDPNAPKAEVVTNRSGRFAVSGLAPGRWRITLRGDPALVYDIVVPEGNLFRAGTISPSSGRRVP